MAGTAFRVEVSNDWKPSSYAYIAVRMKAPDCEADRKVGKVRILRPQLCTHQSDICTTCVNEWAQDYELYFERTVGGRKLQAELASTS